METAQKEVKITAANWYSMPIRLEQVTQEARALAEGLGEEPKNNHIKSFE